MSGRLILVVAARSSYNWYVGTILQQCYITNCFVEKHSRRKNEFWKRLEKLIFFSKAIVVFK